MDKLEAADWEISNYKGQIGRVITIKHELDIFDIDKAPFQGKAKTRQHALLLAVLEMLGGDEKCP